MDVSAACDGRMSDLVKGSYGLKQVYESHNQIGNSMKSDSQECLIAELGNALNVILHVKDAQLHLSESISPPPCDESSRGERYTSSPEIHINQPGHLSKATQENLSKSPNFCSQNAPSKVSSGDAKDEANDIKLGHQKRQDSEDLALKHSSPLSVPAKLISAMKGNREKLGTPVKKLSVTWAPDVYDPPVTSLSHSIKNHSQQRSSSSRSKKHSKRQKGKSSSQGSSSSSGKRYHKHGKSDHHHHHSKSSSPPTSAIPIFGDYRSTLELLDFSVAGKDSKCGSSFLRSSLAEVHIPVAEAT